MILTTATKTVKSIDLEMDWEVIRDERIVNGYSQDLLERIHPSLGVRSILTFKNDEPQYQIFDLEVSNV